MLPTLSQAPPDQLEMRAGTRIVPVHVVVKDKHGKARGRPHSRRFVLLSCCSARWVFNSSNRNTLTTALLGLGLFVNVNGAGELEKVVTVPPACSRARSLIFATSSVTCAVASL